MRSQTRRLLVLSVVALVLLLPGSGLAQLRIGAPAAGNAPALELRQPPPSLAAGLDRHRAWIINRGDLQRLRHTPPLLPVAAWSGVELLESKGQVALDAASQTVTSTSLLKIKSNTNVLSTIYLYMEPLTGSTDKVADASGALQTFDQGSNVLSVSLAKPINAGDVIDLTVTRSGTPQCKSSFLNLVTCELGASVSFSVGMAWQPLLYDVAGYQLLYPVKASLDVKAPAGASAAASGLPAGETSNPDGSKTFSFSNDYEGTFSFGIAPYTFGSATFSGDKIAGTYLYSPAAQQNDVGWQQAVAEIMTFHQARYGAYAPPRVAVAEIPNVTGAAFGPMLTVFVPGALLAYDPKMAGTTSTLAHELAHQWFGGFIQPDDSYSPWLSEGFASFAEMEHTSAVATTVYGVDYRPTYRGLQNQSYIYSVPPSQDVPMTSPQIFTVPSQIYVSVTYTKGALVVGMLRYLLGGDTPFFAALQAYRKDHVDKGASVSTLAASLKAAAGKDLTAFLNAWVYKAGYPTFKVEVQRGGVQGAYSTAIVVKADRAAALPLELELTSADGKRVRKTLTPTGAGTELTLTEQTTAEVLQVRLDPDNQIVGRKLGALPGDLHVNGEVDGIDLIYAAMAQGQQYSSKLSQSFADWADLQFDGIINDKDLAVVTGSFGQQAGDK